jgi:hypothetical protein
MLFRQFLVCKRILVYDCRKPSHNKKHNNEIGYQQNMLLHTKSSNNRRPFKATARSASNIHLGIHQFLPLRYQVPIMIAPKKNYTLIGLHFPAPKRQKA